MAELASTALTDLGDAAVVLPLSVILFSWLFWYHSQRAVMSWAVAFGLCVAVTLLLKTYFYLCPVGSELVSPSGHASISTLTYGALTLVIAAEETKRPRYAAVTFGTGLIVAISGSRVLLDKHSAAEVGIGILIGILMLAWFARCYLRSRCRKSPLGTLLVPAIIAIVIFHGRELSVESLLHAISRQLPVARIACGGISAITSSVNDWTGLGS